MTKKVYLNELIASINKFGFINPFNPNKFYYKYYQDKDPKHKSYLCKSWLGKKKIANELIRFIREEWEKIPSE